MITLRISDLLKPFQRPKPAGCIVLCYHRVSNATADRWRNVVSVENFRDHIRLLASKFRLVSMDELVDTLSDRSEMNTRSVAVTFDDGYAVNRRTACTILLDEKVPATFYQTSAWLENEGPYWWDALQMMFGNGSSWKKASLEKLAGEINIQWNADQGLDRLILIVRDRFKELQHSERQNFIARASTLAPQEHAHALEDCAPASRDDVIAISRESLFTVGGHSHTHPSLKSLDADRQRDEIRRNKETLESIIGRPIYHFSYPFGGTGDFDDITKRELRNAGFRASAAMRRAPVRQECDLFDIPRISVKDWSPRKLFTELDHLWRT